MEKLSIEMYKLYLTEYLVKEHNLSELQAQHIIAKSTINKMLKTPAMQEFFSYRKF